MEAGCGSVKAEASVSIAAGCDPMKVDGLVKMEAGFESARVEAPVGSVKMEPGYHTVKVETPFGGGKAAHLSEAKVVPIENDTAKAAEKQPVVLDAERWWLLQETEVAGRGDTEDFADLGKLARRFLDKNSSQVPSTAMSKRWWMIFVKEKVLSAQFVWRCTQFSHHALIECERRRSLSNIRAIMQAFLNRFRINVEEQWKESSKVEALLHHLQTLSEAGSKSVVFSQWTAFLDLLEIPLKRKNFCFVRLDGTLSQRQREQVLKNFSNIPAVAPSSESSIGQTKNVSIKRFIVKRRDMRQKNWNIVKEGNMLLASARFFAAMADSEGAGDRVASAFDSGSIGDEQGSWKSAMTWNPPQVPPSLSALTATTQADDELGVDVSSPSGDLLLQFLKSVERPFHPPVPYPFPNAPTFQPADNVVHPPHSSGELKARPGLHFESPVFGPSTAETSDSKRAPEQPRRSVTPAKDDKQQFHGNGSELLQLLQGGPGRVKPTASTKVDATRDSGDSGEPSKKGSPSAVHGPIGPPRRHVVSPPQSPNDLLGRLWAALPSSSHTLFDGESERKTSARSFGVEVNEMSREVDGGGAAGFALLKRRGSEPAASHYL
ncbi:hypothetical protein SELMODRAFT_448888 [Selaginella moellendorffii]|uniref:Helicase C-terminal domain-containing protein n=1 Tax=Selaginella moellendorffii TaxID=88036 RepID=D8TAZ8_SELML|nr:hypothetical protein SELMODRAFT_448888 [Selaginella moellendorffii]